MQDLSIKIAEELKLRPSHVTSVLQLLFEEECTIPFIARYRKEMTGSMDEVNLRNVRDRYTVLQDFLKTREKYLKVVLEYCNSNEKFKDRFSSLQEKFMKCTNRQELDDLYMPFKPKRRTRASLAKEKGLEPLLDEILDNKSSLQDISKQAEKFITTNNADIDKKLAVETIEQALSGAADIYAERLNETSEYRSLVRDMSFKNAFLCSKKIEETTSSLKEKNSAQKEKSSVKEFKSKKEKDVMKYQIYFDFRETIKNIPSHRVMAIRRGEAEKILRTSIEVDTDNILSELKLLIIPAKQVLTKSVRDFIEPAIEDAYKRLISPSIETEIRIKLKNEAEEQAIEVFKRNLQNLLLLPPLPNQVVLGVDPGLRTGSKLAAVDATGKVLETATIHPDYQRTDSLKAKQAAQVIRNIITSYKVNCLAIGNGTGSKEVDGFISTVLKRNDIKDIKRVIVNEAGASVYSTEDIAREEFPDLDPTLRSAISIARRLQDPLAELVKINPKSIGVGQYQHDITPNKLSRNLGDVVESCVNQVGVKINTASYKLLSYISGIGTSLAKNIVSYRDKHGAFTSRDLLKNVSGFGDKSFVQAAGFLRVPESENPLDNSGIHPESYEIVEKIFTEQKLSVKDVIGNENTINAIPWETYVTDKIGLPTFKDISKELLKPGRDSREGGSRLLFSDSVSDISDLKVGMQLNGTVTNVTNFGCFVDLGVHQDALIHISELSDTFVDDPAKVVSVGDTINAKVIELDVKRKRISLSLKKQVASNSSTGGAKSNKAGSKKPKKARPPQKEYTVADLMAKFNN